MTIKFEGNVNDLLYVSDDDVIKSTRLVNIGKEMDLEETEIFDVCFTSSDPSGRHKLFNEYLGKKMTVLISFSD